MPTVLIPSNYFKFMWRKGNMELNDEWKICEHYLFYTECRHECKCSLGAFLKPYALPTSQSAFSVSVSLLCLSCQSRRSGMRQVVRKQCLWSWSSDGWKLRALMFVASCMTMFICIQPLKFPSCLHCGWFLTSLSLSNVVDLILGWNNMLR